MRLWPLAKDCSEEMGYDHTALRCWWDNRLIVHYGPLWWLCTGCRDMQREFGPSSRLRWRELPGVYWEGAKDRWLR